MDQLAGAAKTGGMRGGREYLGDVSPSPVPDVARLLRAFGVHAVVLAGAAVLIGWPALAMCLAPTGFGLLFAPSRG